MVGLTFSRLAIALLPLSGDARRTAEPSAAPRELSAWQSTSRTEDRSARSRDSDWAKDDCASYILRRDSGFARTLDGGMPQDGTTWSDFGDQDQERTWRNRG